MSEADPLNSPSWIRRWKLDVSDYYRMGEVGILNRDHDVELIEGQLIRRSDVTPPGADTRILLNAALLTAVADRALISASNPLRLDSHSQVRPDFAVLRKEALGRGYAHPADVFFLAEVAGADRHFDHAARLPLYAHYGVRECWLVNLRDRIVEVCRQPRANGYASIERFGPNAELEPEALPGVRLRLSEIFTA